jgi:hypothetical protein
MSDILLGLLTGEQQISSHGGETEFFLFDGSGGLIFKAFR